MRKKILYLFACIPMLSFAQSKGDMKIGFQFGPNVNFASVKDNNGSPSGAIPAPNVPYVVAPTREGVVADGYTTKQEDASGVNVAFTFDYLLSEHIALHTGLWFAQKNLTIHNQDGSYGGTSKYKTTYWQIPILFKYTSVEIVDKLRWYAVLGPTIDIRASEKLDGGDGAHYWNMSRNDIYLDPSRGKNAEGKKVALFNPVDITLYISGGVTYEIMDKLDLYAGLFLNKGFVNMINPGLRFAEPNETKVNTDISIKSCLFGVEMGVAYTISK
jgi:hypothetical protein